VFLQALAEQQKAQQLAQQQAGAPQAGAAPGQVQAPAAGAQVPQAAAVAGATAVPNAAVLVRIKTSSADVLPHKERFKILLLSETCAQLLFCVFQAGAIKNATVGTTIQAGMLTYTWFISQCSWCFSI